MQFTIVFNGNEAVDKSYGLMFIPCPVFVSGNEEVLNLNPDKPNLQPGCIKALINKEKLQDIRKCVVVVHSIGHGTSKDLSVLQEELKMCGIAYKVIYLEEI